MHLRRTNEFSELVLELRGRGGRHDMSLRLSIITAPPSGNGTHGVAEFQPRLVKLRFAITDGTVEHGSDFIMLVSLDIVQHEDEPVAGGKVGDGAFQRQAVDGPGQREVRSSKLRPGPSSGVGSMASSSEIRERPFLRRCIKTTLMARRCNQVEKAESPRKVAILRCS